MRQSGLAPLVLFGVLTVGTVSGVLVALSVSGVPLGADSGLSAADGELAEAAIGQQPDAESDGKPVPLAAMQSDNLTSSPAQQPTTTVVAGLTASSLLTPSTDRHPEIELWSAVRPATDAYEVELDTYGVFAAPSLDSRLASFVIVDGMVLSSAGAVDGRDDVWLRVAGQWAAAGIVVADPYTDVAVLQAFEPLPEDLLSSSVSDEPPLPGALVSVGIAPISVGRSDDDAGGSGYVGMPGKLVTTSLNRVCYGAFTTSLLSSVTPPGSAVLNDGGSVVGMAISTGEPTAAAVPITVARDVARSMMESGSPSSSWLGIEAVADSNGRTLVFDVVPSGPAADVLQADDVIVSIDGQPVQNPDHLVHLVRRIEIDVETELTIERDGTTESVSVWPAPITATR